MQQSLDGKITIRCTSNHCEAVRYASKILSMLYDRIDYTLGCV